MEGRKIHMEEIVAAITDLYRGPEEVVNQINILRGRNLSKNYWAGRQN